MSGFDAVRRRRAVIGWFAAVAVTLVLAGTVPLWWNGRYYYSGDDQVAYLGWWYELGAQLRAGHWPLLDVQSWRAGNAVAEGQWGLFSPLTMAIGLAASAADNVLVFVTVVKIGLVVVCGLGVYLLVRSYRVGPAWAYVAGVVAPLSGQAQYVDWASWDNGLMVAALLPWAWWSLRRTMRPAVNPVVALLACYLIVSVGYVYGTLYLSVVIVATLVECLLAGNRAGFVRVLLVGVFGALVAVAVYLPGVLTSPVTIRQSWEVVGEGPWTVDVDALFSSMLPVNLKEGLPAPNRYLAWVVPLLMWVDGSRLRRHWREFASLLIVTAVMLAWVLAPNAMGPIRWPVRVMSALSLPLVVSVVVLLARTGVARPSAIRLMGTLAWVAAAWWVVTARLGDVRGVTSVGAAVVALALAGLWVAVRARRASVLPCLAGAATLLVLATQHYYFPDPPSPDRHLPARAADYKRPLSAAVGDTIVVGSSAQDFRRDPRMWEEVLLGSTWFLNEHAVHNTGTAISYRAYFERFCMGWSGFTCPEALQRLFDREPETGRPWADLMDVSTVLIANRTYPGMRMLRPPPGWHVGAVGSHTVTWLRDDPLPTAGGVVWSSPGTSVSGVSSSDRSLSMRVDDVPSGGGRVVLSRLAWPGYRVEGGGLGRPVGDMLLTVDVPAGASGETLRVRYSPPGWRLELASWWLAIGFGLAWSALHLVLHLRRRRATASGSGGADEPDGQSDSHLSPVPDAPEGVQPVR